MRLKKSFTFLYMPEDHSRVRQVRIRSAAFVLTVIGLVGLVALAAFYLVGLWRGSSWLPGGSVLVRENARLTSRIGHLEEQISLLRADLAEVYQVQELVSVAVGLDPLNPAVWEAGIGGRRPPPSLVVGLSPAAKEGELASLETELDKMLRQARIQHQGYRALLDTLAAQAEARDHIPSIRPIDTGWLSSGFGKRADPFTGKLTYHHGLDFSAPNGTPVRATADGVISAVKHERGFGRLIKIDHGQKVVTLYAHLSRQQVKKGQRVVRGQLIGATGKSGRVTAPHLHYEVRVNDRRVNPLPFILDSYAAR